MKTASGFRDSPQRAIWPGAVNMGHAGWHRVVWLTWSDIECQPLADGGAGVRRDAEDELFAGEDGVHPPRGGHHPHQAPQHQGWARTERFADACVLQIAYNACPTQLVPSLAVCAHSPFPRFYHHTELNIKRDGVSWPCALVPSECLLIVTWCARNLWLHTRS
jgi:hypothetical protein